MKGSLNLSPFPTSAAAISLYCTHTHEHAFTTHTCTQLQQMFSPISWIRGFSIDINYLLKNRRCQNVSQAKLPDPLESVEERMEMKRGISSCCVVTFLQHEVASVDGGRTKCSTLTGVWAHIQSPIQG